MPPIDDKDFQDMVSSADPQDGQSADVEQDVTDTVDADTSAATGETGEHELLSVVRDVVDKRETEGDDQSASPAEGEEAEGQGEQDDEDDYSKIPFNKHPDFQRLVRKKNEFRDQARAYEQDAERYRNVQAFMDQHNLVPEEAADLLIIGGLMKTDPVEAWRRAKPTIQKLLLAAGEVLPDDLKTRVQNGELSQDAALEVSRSRAAQQSLHATRSFEEQRRQHMEQTQTVNALRQTATDWEADRRAKDPNFEAKMPLLEREVLYLQRTEGVPNTPEGVKAQLQKAYKAVVLPVTPTTRPNAASKPAITPIRGGQVAGGATPEVNSTMDVLKNVMAKRRSA